LDGAGAVVGLAAGAEEEVGDDVEAFALGGADEGDRVAELFGEGEGVDLTAAGLELVGHVEQHERGQADGEDRRGEHELAVHVRGVEDEEDAVGDGDAGHLAGEDFDGYAGVFGVGGERIDAGEVDEREVAAADGLHLAGVVLDGDARVVGYLLAHASEAVEEGRLAAVWRADERDGAEALGAGGCGNCGCEFFGEVGGRRVAAHAASFLMSFRKMCLAVSLRRPTSTPSMR